MVDWGTQVNRIADEFSSNDSDFGILALVPSGVLMEDFKSNGSRVCSIKSSKAGLRTMSRDIYNSLLLNP
ncbi:hypothetical protein BpHYR1_001288 [Brachionus plicatilis]|uniref:Uncharacterized protein n=1 Tax=Brachionus plicatilis TaxID=10195 RepID=A0A3M7SXS8_BRAPC|nr:hypothetical protein BpHYR1_001288 [Brachionus plicatilis]